MINNVCKIDAIKTSKLYDIFEADCKEIKEQNNKVVLIINEKDKRAFIGLQVLENRIKVLSNVLELEEDDYKNLIKKCNYSSYVFKLEEDIDDILKKCKFEIKIESISDYIEVTSSIASNNVLFRGQANKEWKLAPSIFRSGTDLEKEKNLYKEVNQWNYPEFCSESYIENLCNMQHYGIPTRLVDLSSNPLKSLYFAVVNDSNKDNDGKVFCIKANKIYEEKSPEYVLIDEYLNNRFSDKSEINKELVNKLIYNEENYFFIKTKYYNNRIRNQQGLFTIYIDISENEKEYIENNIKPIIIKDNISKFIREQGYSDKENFSDKRIEEIINARDIPKEKMDKIVKYLEEVLSVKVEQQQKDLLKEIFESARIKLSEIVKENNIDVILEKEPILNIIIPSELKSIISQRLDIIEVNSRSVYPDKEGLSMYIREKYV